MNVSQSLWLPIGRANFFSIPEDRKFLHVSYGEKKLRCSVALDHHPNLQVSTIRRLLEVLPAFYGYDATAVYESAELAEGGQPVRVTLSLTPEYGYEGPTGYRRAQANGSLIQAGVTALSLTVTEDGFFTWTAQAPEDSVLGPEGLSAANRYGDNPQHMVREALRAHIKELFGGNFSLRRIVPWEKEGQSRTAVHRRRDSWRQRRRPRGRRGALPAAWYPDLLPAKHAA
jgi:hypothetical protein